ncbi:hypothetical protein [Arthrobacter sulfonylureivorans]|uniref:Cytoplasmic protein n=1 Tax=Arthrobacter sulfonylureivorans TaxID=2486855 RepID=A0ABY3W9E3_9MICC|nr:hypothetical protein [Arthrobacter sulfonylureivorans]UNK46072.1 hypothetical protein MNQ99_01445 [Arthrobacter sulfonylureivorans]
MTAFNAPWDNVAFPEPLADGLPAHPRPAQHLLETEKAESAQRCSHCPASEVRQYRVLSEGGWWNVAKCQTCLRSIARTPAPIFGSYKPLGLVPAIRFGKETN